MIEENIGEHCAIIDTALMEARQTVGVFTIRIGIGLQQTAHLAGIAAHCRLEKHRIERILDESLGSTRYRRRWTVIVLRSTPTQSDEAAHSTG